MTRTIAGHQEVVEMAQAGMAPREIAQSTGLSINTIGYDLYTARQQGVAIPKFAGGRPRRPVRYVRIDRSAISALEAEAIRRGLTVHCLAAMILNLVAEDDLVGAILDDGGCHGA